MMAAVRTAASAALLCALSSAAPALAQEPLSRGRAAYENADFRSAIELLTQAEATQELSTEELALLLETRALARSAIGDGAGTDRDLARLARLDPDHRFGPEVPPEFIARFERIRDALPGPVTVGEGGGPTAPDRAEPPLRAEGSLALGTPMRDEASDADDGPSAWPWIAAGAGAAIVVGIVLVLVVGSAEPSGETPVAGPFVGTL